jgi:hypothetical protein
VGFVGGRWRAPSLRNALFTNLSNRLMKIKKPIYPKGLLPVSRVIRPLPFAPPSQTRWRRPPRPHRLASIRLSCRPRHDRPILRRPVPHRLRERRLAVRGGGEDQRLRPRLPLRRRGLRGDLGPRRPADRPRPAHGPPPPLARGTLHARPGLRRRAGGDPPRADRPQFPDRGHGLPPGHPRRRRPGLRLSRRSEAQPRPLHPGPAPRRHARRPQRHPGGDPAGPALEAARHQDGPAPRPLDDQDGRPGRG